MAEDNRKWDVKRSEQLRASMSDAELSALMARSNADPRSLTLDEVGVLFLVTRDRIRAIEAKALGKGGSSNGGAKT